MKKLCASLIVCALLCITILPQKTEAQWIVSDPITEVNTGLTAGATLTNTFGKEFGLDTIAFMIINVVIERIAASTVNWINGGFQGQPGFITDPGQYFGNIANGIAGQYIYSNPNFSFMCAPFRARIQIALSQSYNQPLGQFQCTLTGVVDNFDNFINDFNQGGWDGFVQVTQNPQNNPIGLYFNWQQQVNSAVAAKNSQAQQEAQWGRGLLSFKSCTRYTQADIDGIKQATGGFAGMDVGSCVPGTEKTNTPGSVVETQLNNVLNTGNSRLQVADEINEIISALLSQLAGRIVGGIGSGLRSLSGGSNGQGSYAESLQNATANDSGTAQALVNANQSISTGDNLGGTIGTGGTGAGGSTGTTCQTCPAGATGELQVSVNGGTCTPISQIPLETINACGGGSTGGTNTGGTGTSNGTTLTVSNINSTQYNSNLTNQINALNLTQAQIDNLIAQGVTPGSVLAYMLSLGNQTSGSIVASGQIWTIGTDGRFHKFTGDTGGSTITPSLPVTFPGGAIINSRPNDPKCATASIASLVQKTLALKISNSLLPESYLWNNIQCNSDGTLQ